MVVESIIIALSICMAAVVVCDVARYIIPNSLNLAILLLYVGACFILPLDPLMALAAAGCVLAVGLLIFAFGFMGGGDIKLLVVLTLWTGWGSATASFIMLTAVFGGALVVLVLFLRAVAAPQVMKARPGKNLPRILTAKQPVPYGIAIAVAFLFMLHSTQVPGLM